MTTVLLADDQDDFRQGLADLLTLESDLQVVGQARHGGEAINLATALQPQVILMDMQMPICDGVTATRHIHQQFPWMRILALTTFDDDDYIFPSLQAGAWGYLLKRSPIEQIITSIRSVALGYSQLSPTIAAKVFTQIKPPSSDALFYLQALSKREIEVLRCIGLGQNNREIAKNLAVTEGTVKNHVTQILDKLQMRDRIQAALWAQKNLC